MKRPSWRAALLLLVPLGALALGVLYPTHELVRRSLLDASGESVGVAHYRAYFQTPGLVHSLYNTLNVGATVAALATAFSFAVAWAVTHARVFGDRAFRYLVLLPLYVPSVFFPIGMIHLFGRHGVLRNVVRVDDIYGRSGIVFGLVVFILPHTVLLLATTLRGIDRRLYVAARTLGASPWRRFRTITWPAARSGVLRAWLVAFILAITDFGIPKVLGGDYAMLSTELYLQIIGMQNLGLGSAIGVMMLIPSVLAFAFDTWLLSRSPDRANTERFVRPDRARGRDAAATVFAWAVAFVPAAIMLAAVAGAFVTFWPYDRTFTTAHFRFEESVYGLRPFWNSVVMAALAAVAGATLAFVGAYLTGRTNAPEALKIPYRGLAFLSLGIPGTVLGLAFVFAFNRAGFAGLYGSRACLAFYCVVHFYAMAHLMSAAGLASVDARYEAAGRTLGVGAGRTFFRVILPLRFTVALDVAFYFFINAMTTVSGMVFIFAPDTVPASVTMLHSTDTGQYGEAAAMGSLILAATLAARILQEIVGAVAARRSR